jgi:hypothetical protein
MLVAIPLAPCAWAAYAAGDYDITRERTDWTASAPLLGWIEGVIARNRAAEICAGIAHAIFR